MPAPVLGPCPGRDWLVRSSRSRRPGRYGVLPVSLRSGGPVMARAWWNWPAEPAAMDNNVQAVHGVPAGRPGRLGPSPSPGRHKQQDAPRRNACVVVSFLVVAPPRCLPRTSGCCHAEAFAEQLRFWRCLGCWPKPWGWTASPEALQLLTSGTADQVRHHQPSGWPRSGAGAGQWVRSSTQATTLPPSGGAAPASWWQATRPAAGRGRPPPASRGL